MIRETHQVHRNEKLRGFFAQYPDPHDHEILHKLLQFIKDEFPECRDALNGKLIYEEIHDGHNKRRVS